MTDGGAGDSAAELMELLELMELMELLELLEMGTRQPITAQQRTDKFEGRATAQNQEGRERRRGEGLTKPGFPLLSSWFHVFPSLQQRSRQPAPSRGELAPRCCHGESEEREKERERRGEAV